MLAGGTGKYWNVGDDDSSGDDGLHILFPTQKLVDSVNETDQDYNDCFYVILYCTGNNQANCIVVNASTRPMILYVTHENFARRVNSPTFYHNTFKTRYIRSITEDLIS